jgi:hypothetical protein
MSNCCVARYYYKDGNWYLAGIDFSIDCCPHQTILGKLEPTTALLTVQIKVGIF